MPSDATRPPDLSGPISAQIRRLDRALVVPPAPGGPNRAVQRSGVLDDAGRPVVEATTWRGMSPVTVAPAPPEGPVDELAGRWLFLGPLFGHFGHFLVESISRLWALDALRGEIDGVLYVPKFQHRVQHVAETYRPFLGALGVDVPMHSLERPTRVERLCVPVQGFGMFEMIEGAPEFRDYMRRHAGRDVAPKGARKIYISRSALPAGRGSILGEARLEAWLEADGYEVFHPQKHEYLTQIAAYKAATHVVAVDCSPLHLLALVGHAEQKVGIIARRPGGLGELFARQIRAFTGADAVAVDALQRNWIEQTAQRPDRTSWGEVDYAAIGSVMTQSGLVTSSADWTPLDATEVQTEIARLAPSMRSGLKAFEG